MGKYNHDDIVHNAIEHIKKKSGVVKVEISTKSNLDIYTITFDNKVSDYWMKFIDASLYGELVDIYNPGDPYEDGVYLGYIFKTRREKDAI